MSDVTPPNRTAPGDGATVLEMPPRQGQPSDVADRQVPLVVDLDGTLIRTDLLAESVVALARVRPQDFWRLPGWWLRGRACLKHELARRTTLDVSLLPYRTEVVQYLKAERTNGRTLVLVTASDERLAAQVAAHIGLFEWTLGSDGRINLAGEQKRACLVERFGVRGFDYVANTRDDLAVWASARRAVVVSASERLVRAVGRRTPVQRVFADRAVVPREYLRALRPQQWLKNLLVFVPLLAAHRLGELARAYTDLLVFLALCCGASGGYLVNDLLDLAADRRHPRKRSRPFAAGRLPLSYAVGAAPALMALACVLAGLVTRSLVGIVLLYEALAVTYSIWFKTVALLDVMVLAGLYTLRIIAGGAAVALWPSEWLLAFSMFLFLSLALVKRYDELVVMRRLAGHHARARGYDITDAELLAAQGTACGFIAVLVLALYIANDASRGLYQRHAVLWFLCPLLFYWVGYVWLTAHRGAMEDDPVLFALRDRTTRLLMALMVATAILAA